MAPVLVPVGSAAVAAHSTSLSDDSLQPAAAAGLQGSSQLSDCRNAMDGWLGFHAPAAALFRCIGLMLYDTGMEKFDVEKVCQV